MHGKVKHLTNRDNLSVGRGSQCLVCRRGFKASLRLVGEAHTPAFGGNRRINRVHFGNIRANIFDIRVFVY